jgi:hypothetical protein
MLMGVAARCRGDAGLRSADDQPRFNGGHELVEDNPVQLDLCDSQVAGKIVL